MCMHVCDTREGLYGSGGEHNCFSSQALCTHRHMRTHALTHTQAPASCGHADATSLPRVL